MDNLADKVDEVLSVLGDIRANEKLTEHRFLETDRRHDELKQRLNAFEDHVDKTMATKDEVAPVKRLVYGAVCIVMAAVLTAVVALVVIQPSSTVIEKPKQEQR